MYLNYEIQLNGYKTIYLGETVPINSLKDVKKYFDNIVYVCYTTVEPNTSIINDYVKQIKREVLTDDSEMWFIGRMIESIDKSLVDEKMKIFTSIDNLVQRL